MRRVLLAALWTSQLRFVENLKSENGHLNGNKTSQRLLSLTTFLFSFISFKLPNQYLFQKDWEHIDGCPTYET